MKIYEETAIIQEVAALIRKWGLTASPGGLRQCGSWFGYWEEINRSGQFQLADGRIAVLDAAELRMALNLAAAPQTVAAAQRE